MIYTGGTTGQPKGVMLEAANIAATATMIVDWFGTDQGEDRCLVLPLFLEWDHGERRIAAGGGRLRGDRLPV